MNRFVCFYYPLDETADIVCGEYKKKRGTLHVAVPLFEAFALPSLLKQQPKSTPYVLILRQYRKNTTRNNAQYNNVRERAKIHTRTFSVAYSEE